MHTNDKLHIILVSNGNEVLVTANNKHTANYSEGLIESATIAVTGRNWKSSVDNIGSIILPTVHISLSVRTAYVARHLLITVIVVYVLAFMRFYCCGNVIKCEVRQ